MKQPIQYWLDREWAEGKQPYVRMQELGLNFDWGIVAVDGVYLWIIEWEQEQINVFLQNNEFNAKALTNEEAIAFYTANVSEYTMPWSEEVITIEMQVADFTAKL